jgi:hypothetical protein
VNLNVKKATESAYLSWINHHHHHHHQESQLNCSAEKRLNSSFWIKHKLVPKKERENSKKIKQRKK